MQWFAVVLAAVVILWTVLPLLRGDAWWIRVFDFPRVQIAVLSAAAIPAYIAAAGVGEPLDWLLVGGLAVCLAWQLTSISRYTPLRKKQAEDAADPLPENCVGILIANVLTPNRRAGDLLRIIAGRDPDVVLCVETDEWWQSQLDELARHYPYVVRNPDDNLYGMHLYSRLELVDPQVKFLVEKGVPSIHAGLRLRSGQCVDLHCVHPMPPSPTENDRSAERDAELLVVAKAIAESDGPAIVCGDLNDVAWSATTHLFQKISGMLDPRIGRGMFSTFHASYPFLRWPLDHVFFSTDFTLASMQRLGYFGSDHFPIYAELCHSPRQEPLQEKPTPDASDREWAEEKIDEVDVRDEPPTAGA